jgi:hypothetical protein
VEDELMEYEVHVVDGVNMMDPSGLPPADPLKKLRDLMETGKFDEALTEMRTAFERELLTSVRRELDDGGKRDA